jgi:hypothetical protein
MYDLDSMGWRAKLDRLELDADPGLIPLIISLRGDMEIMAAAATKWVDAEELLREVRRQLLDVIAVRQEHRAEV